jgi:3-oxoacyl-[acyl-carrier-protein] synthase-3
VKQSNGQRVAPRAVIRATGVCFPSRRVTSDEIDTRLGKPAGWLRRQSGVDARTVAGPGETQEVMAVSAARQALAEAGLAARDLDLLLFGAAVGRQPIPATAPLVKRGLGCENAPFPAYDINATCLSALAAIDIAAMHIETGRARNVLVVASEIASRALPWDDDPQTAALFGDGAAAVLLSAGDADGAGIAVGPRLFETYESGYDACTLAAGGTRFDFHAEHDAFERNSFFKMEGQALFKLSGKVLPGFMDRLLEMAGCRQRDIDLVLPHQASPIALEHMIRKSGFARDRVFNRASGMGNLVAVSLPAILHLARREGMIAKGARIMMIGTSAGISVGGAVLQA